MRGSGEERGLRAREVQGRVRGKDGVVRWGKEERL